MPREIDRSLLTPIDTMKGEDEQETREFFELHRAAKAYMESFRWHGQVKDEYFGLGLSPIVAVFLFELIPTPGVDKLLWVVVGDIPPAYLVIDNAPTPVCALRLYIDLMKEWVAAVNAGKSARDLIPVTMPPTIENADDLEKRLKFIEEHVVPQFS